MAKYAPKHPGPALAHAGGPGEFASFASVFQGKIQDFMVVITSGMVTVSPLQPEDGV